MTPGRLAFLLSAFPFAAWSHTSEGGFVLLLPTGAYITAGVAAVALTVLVLFAARPAAVRALFAWRAVRFTWAPEILPVVTSVLSFLLLASLVTLGLAGPRGPLDNLLPLSFWTVGWMALVPIAAVAGDPWRWINPWTGLLHLLSPIRPKLTPPPSLGVWPALILLIAFAAFLLVDVAPDDPRRLAVVVAIYWLVTMVGCLVCGEGWTRHAELGRVVLSTYASLAPIRWGPNGGVGGPGWRALAAPPLAGLGLFALTLLAVGSFDGINETFWWLGLIGVNPLEFPGRSAVVLPTMLGLGGAILALWAIFALTVRAGLALAGGGAFTLAVSRLALALLPIALAYHIAHYLTAIIVGLQYWIAALNDPLHSGADLLGLAPFRVSTGMFNRLDLVRVIWLTQAAVVVAGHVWSVLLSHRMALDIVEGDHARAVRLTLPLSAFMVAYTFLGLWLLAAPRGA